MGTILDMGQDQTQAQPNDDESSTFSSRLRQSRIFSAPASAGSHGARGNHHSAVVVRQPNVLAEGLGWGLGLGLSFWLSLGLLLQVF